MRGFSEALRSELRLSGTGVTTVHPGGIRTGIARNARAASGVGGGPRAGVEAFDRFLPSRRTAPPTSSSAVEHRSPGCSSA